MCLDLCAQFMQMLYDGTVHRTAQIRMLVGNYTSFIAYAVVDILQASFAEELVTRLKRHLYDAAELVHFLRRVVGYVCDALEVGDELLDDAFPCHEALDEDV